MIELLDTNVILRYVVGDDKKQHEQSKHIFKEAQQGKRMLVVKALVIAECCFVLESFYKKSHQEIAEPFEVILSQKWLKVEERETLLGALHRYLEGKHFVDAYLSAAALVEGGSICTFDKKLLRSSNE